MENNKKNFIISIKRANDKYVDFSLNLDASLTVIDALDEIRFKMDPTLGYRHSCHHGSCGTCACMINGEEKLACMTFLKDLETNKITIEPLRNFKVISDLIVDISTMINKMEGSYLRESELSPSSIKPNGIFQWNRFENCIECGSCSSACPVNTDFIGPAPLASIHREILKQTDENSIKELEDIAYAENGVKACEKHFACSKVCPTKVSPGKHINDLRKKEKDRIVK
jgi:succinate dehydrogenase / fumarate reductase iron-sulfur subunit